MLYFTNEHVKVEYDEIIGCIRTTWKGFVKGEKYREAWDQGLELAKIKDCNKWLYNQREQLVSDPEDTKWLMEDFFPRAYPTFKGQVKIAIVISTDMFERIVTLNTVKDVHMFREGGKAINMQYFEIVSDAEKWLLSFSN